MATAKRDDNRIPTLIGVSSADLTTPILVAVDPATNELLTQTAVTVTGVATAANQTNGSQKTQIVDGSGNVIGSTSNALDINIKSGNPTSIAVTQGTATNLKAQAEAYQGGTAVGTANPLQVSLANTGANATAIKVDGSAVTQPVSLASVPSHAVTNVGTFAVQVDGDALTSLQLIDDTVYTDGVGTPSKGILIMGSDTTNPQAIITDATGHLQVDVLTVPSTTVTATNLDIRDLTSASDSVAAVCTNAGTFAVQATLAAETTKVIGTINVAASQTIAVTQSVAADLNCTEASASAIKTAVELIDNSVDGNYLNVNNNIAGTDIVGGAGAVAAGVQRVTLASDDPAVTALQVIDNIVSGSEAQVDVVAALPAGTNALGKLLPPDIDVTAHTNYARKYYTSAGAATDGIIWSPAAGKRWHITSLYFQTSADATITFEDDKAGGDDPVLKGEYKAGSGVALTFDEKYPFASGEDAADFMVTTSAGNIYVSVVGYEI